MFAERFASAGRSCPRVAAGILFVAMGSSLAIAEPVLISNSTPETVVAEPTVQARDAFSGPGFLIEAIVVEGTARESVKHIVVSQSRLVAGREYAEPEIRDAVHNVKRLPFIVGAQPQLRRGSSPGKYVLALVVEEISTVALDAGGTVNSAGDLWADVGADWTHFTSGTDLFALSGTAGTHSGSSTRAGFGASYNRYDAFGRASLLSFDLSATLNAHEYRMLSASANAVVPIASVRSLAFNLDVSASNWFSTGSTYNLGATASWIRDTRDDPLVPTSGSRLSLGPQLSHTIESTAVVRYSSGKPVRGTLIYQQASLVGRFGTTKTVWRALTVSAYLSGRGSLRHESNPLSLYDELWSASGSLSAGLVHVGSRNRLRAFVNVGMLSALANGSRRVAARYDVWWPWRAASISVGLRSKWATITFSYHGDYIR